MRHFSCPVGLGGFSALSVVLLIACQDSPPPGHKPRDGGPGDSGSTSPEDAAVRDMTPGVTCPRPFAGSAAAQHPLFERRAAGKKRGWSPGHKDTDDDDDDKYVVRDASCRSGWRWIGDDHESDLMQPGTDCIGCHRLHGDDNIDDDDAPQFALAGTLYGALNEPDDCLGVQGATIRITDALGKPLQLVSNRAGNFYIKSKSARIALPFSAEVLFEGRSRKMMAQQCETSCNVCHTAQGVNGAPGRILAP